MAIYYLHLDTSNDTPYWSTNPNSNTATDWKMGMMDSSPAVPQWGQGLADDTLRITDTTDVIEWV